MSKQHYIDAIANALRANDAEAFEAATADARHAILAAEVLPAKLVDGNLSEYSIESLLDLYQGALEMLLVCKIPEAITIYESNIYAVRNEITNRLDDYRFTVNKIRDAINEA